MALMLQVDLQISDESFDFSDLSQEQIESTPFVDRLITDQVFRAFSTQASTVDSLV